MDEPWLHNYIPAGCLRFSADDNNPIPAAFWALPEVQIWKSFTLDNDAIPNALSLSQTYQAALFGTRTLQPLECLFRHRWIQLQVKAEARLVRVYIFPHDLDSRVIDRRDAKLTKALGLLLTQLDFSPSAWGGSSNSPIWSHPLPIGDDGTQIEEDEDNCSLLERFNNVPSPNPRLDAVSRDDATLMQAVLDSQIPGLQTTLYPYQRRSAALMLQRELQPGRIIDPRLRAALDQRKEQWFFDTITGTVFRTPRYYDGARGGILAEEMGTGKTIICLALILATKFWPTTPPEPLSVDIPVRRKMTSLVDMAAAAVNRHSYPWKLWADRIPENCIGPLESRENIAFYEVRNPLVEARKGSRVKTKPQPARKVHLSSTTLIIVPPNLVQQWQHEIKKHTTGLKVITIEEMKDHIPPVSILLAHDVVLFAHNRFEKIERERSAHCPLEYIRFKRCIIDEGHKLGNGSGQWKSDLMKVIDNLEIVSRWIVTGTPSRGLYGVDQKVGENGTRPNRSREGNNLDIEGLQEQQDLTRIGNIASKFLKIRPWCNTREEVGDTVADWAVYVMQPKHSKKSAGRKDCLKTTLESLIIRHRLSDVNALLPPVDEKIVVLDGSYQDRLSQGLFNMMIIFNSVQSQRTDRDFFFHAKQRKSLIQLVNNLKQASFFGGVFYSKADIAKALETAEGFLQKKELPISSEDHDLLRNAIAFGEVVVNNRLKDVSNQYHSMPLYLEHFPGGDPGQAWALDGRGGAGEPILTDAHMVSSLQKFLNPCIDAPTSLQLMIESGRLHVQGEIERTGALKSALEETGASKVAGLAGNTPLGEDHHAKPKSGSLPRSAPYVDAEDTAAPLTDMEIAEPLAKTRIISTVSAKLSYLIDSIVKYQEVEQIIIFYENDNVAYYLAGVLEILQIQHLIYTRVGLSAERRAQYVATFTHNQKFRVLLMDISQAAFGLDMRSASRIYFISPVLNPQVEAQAIGRARRISQQKPVTVETLVLSGSIEEVIIERRKTMTQAEHRKVKSLIDDKPIYDWILNAKTIPLPELEDGVAQTAMLKTPQFVFGRGFGRELHPDEGLVTDSPEAKGKSNEKRVDVDSMRDRPIPFALIGVKRSHTSSPVNGGSTTEGRAAVELPSKKKARIAQADDKP
ncbi:P-loop containing nucleoside triphosphate hydrolase protein [Pseudomassariella vexata]|uniref:p-loop containing nucleoside triphosphate hydrolase protein n=1 Tax=Pseudomassariella vexata TaxID=1141098 RepID=A0A1Y2DE15_9PEZI|nr:P-loop containing nucleoside triphosphate hydrolase protein [Pseudomassariella vexata]ORY57522.1 P-loop containing nucleoside triphosphate hydrolase protein [Pseudomassariella vexata]